MFDPVRMARVRSEGLDDIPDISAEGIDVPSVDPLLLAERHPTTAVTDRPTEGRLSTLSDEYDPADPYNLRRYLPIHTLNLGPRSRNGRSGREVTDVNEAALALGNLNCDEVLRLNIPSPKLFISLENKADVRAIADATRAFVRDVKKYFPLVKGGHLDEVRCLFLTSALEGRAKRFHDEWTLAQEDGYSSDGFLSALLARFAPQIQPRDQEARQKLAQGRYRMRAGETVTAYQARFEALATAIPDLSESERKFWFYSGLNDLLYEHCASDDKGLTFAAYDDLVNFALRKERQFDAAKLARVPGARFNFLSTEVMTDSENPATKRRKISGPSSAGPSVAAVVSRATAHKGLRKKSIGDKKPHSLTKFGCSYEEYQRRRNKDLCLACGEANHSVRVCQNPAWIARKASLDEAKDAKGSG